MIRGNSKYPEWSIHLLFWVVYILFEIVERSWGHRDYLDIRYAHELWLEIPSKVILVYVNLYLLVPYFFRKKKYFVYLSILLGCMFLGGLYIRYVSYKVWIPRWESLGLLEYGPEPKEFFLPIRIFRNSFDFYPLIVLTFLLQTLRDLYNKEREKRELEKNKFQSELAMLKAQFHPHFFFNALNNLYALSLKKSEKTPFLIMQLSGLMQYVLQEARAEYILLEKDIEHMKNYIALERVRYGDRLDVSFQSSGDLLNKKILPLILLPFVENAFKHGLYETDHGWITLDLKVVDNMLHFRCENSLSKHKTLEHSSGIGLNNVRRRLELAYPGKFILKLKKEENSYLAELNLNLHG